MKPHFKVKQQLVIQSIKQLSPSHLTISRSVSELDDLLSPDHLLFEPQFYVSSKKRRKPSQLYLRRPEV